MLLLYTLADIITTLLNLVSLVIIVSSIINLLIYFEVVNRFRHKFVYKLDDLLRRLTEPMYRFVRRYIPPFNGVDLSPLVILLAIQFFEKILYAILGSIA